MSASTAAIHVVNTLLLFTITGIAYYGLHRLKHVWTCATRDGDLAGSPPAVRLPHVCVQCALFNEPLVVEELLECVSALRWDGDLSMQILDDSTDQTPALIQTWIAEHPHLSHRIQHIQRANRAGFKAGALAEGMQKSDAEYFAIFDADFRPEPGFLNRVMPLFAASELGVIQARWEFRNRNASLLTRLQGIILDVHFVIEQWGRSARHLYFNFNGTAGIWRRLAIEDAGGWSADSVTEDLDLSYRAQRRGWRFAYLRDYTVLSELPESLTAFKAQQHRWTKGGAQVARVQMMPSLSEATDWRLKSEALAHLSIGFVHPLTTCFSVLLLPYLYFRSFSATTALSTATDLATACFLVAIPLACYFASQYFRTGRFSDCWRGAAFLPALLAFGFGMNLHYTYAFIEGLLCPGGEFERTPKGGHAARNSGLLRRFTTARRSKVLITGELAMGLLLGLGAISLWPAVPVHWLLLVSLFSFGYLWIGAQSLYESLRLR